MGTGDYPWDDDAIAWLKELWAEGGSATQIAETMGGGLTRSAILGKASRIGLYRQARRHQVRVGKPVVPIIRLSAATARALVRAVPPDTRTLMQRFFGDPPPGRSALDRKMGLSTGDHVSKSVLLLAPEKDGVFMEDRHSNLEAVDDPRQTT